VDQLPYLLESNRGKNGVGGGGGGFFHDTFRADQGGLGDVGGGFGGGALGLLYRVRSKNGPPNIFSLWGSGERWVGEEGKFRGSPDA